MAGCERGLVGKRIVRRARGVLVRGAGAGRGQEIASIDAGFVARRLPKAGGVLMLEVMAVPKASLEFLRRSATHSFIFSSLAAVDRLLLLIPGR